MFHRLSNDVAAEPTLARILKRAAILALALGLAACGGGGTGDDDNGDDDDDSTTEPHLIEGGGADDGSIAGRVNVYVIDDDTNAPISGAAVRIGEPDDPDALTGTTDGTGLFTITDASLAGPTTIAAGASAHAGAAWYGIDAVNVTIPLRPLTPGGNVPQATLTGSIDGWEDLALPSPTAILIAGVGASQVPRLGAPENEIAQPPNVAVPPLPGTYPAGVCIRSALATTCDWTVIARTGTLALFAPIIELETHGTATGDDDEYTVIGFAYQRGVTVSDGVDQNGIRLTMTSAGQLTNTAIHLAATPPALDTVAAVLGLDLGDEGIAQIGLALQGREEATVLELDGDFSGMSYRLTAAANTGNQGQDEPASVILKRGITSLASVDTGAWLDTPTGLSATSGTYSFTASSGAAVHAATFRSGSTDVFSAVLFDSRTSFSLPPLAADPLPGGSVDLVVQEIDVQADLGQFTVDGLLDSIDRSATEKTSFTH